MRAVLLGPVRARPREEKKLWDSLELRPSDLRIGVDGGSAIWFKKGILPELSIGDWDSLKNSKKILKKCVHITLPQDKDRSDLFYAGVAAIEAGADEILCLGVTGGRPDHHLAMLLDLSVFSSGRYGKLKKIEVRGPEATYFFLSDQIPLWRGNLIPGQIVSVFSMSNVCQGVSLAGFQYSLKNTILRPSSLGLSNCVVRKQVSVQLKSGRMLLVVNPPSR